MARTTDNYNLNLVDGTDAVEDYREKFNENMGIIDENMGGGGGGGGDVMDVEVNGVSVLDPDDKIAKITSYKEVTQAEYDALPASKTSDGVAYFVKDSGSIDSYFTVINGVPYVIFDDGN